MAKKVLKRDVLAAERTYADAQAHWGENNMVTQRAMAAWYELRQAYEEQKRSTAP